MDFIKMNVQKLNIPKLIHACERPGFETKQKKTKQHFEKTLKTCFHIFWGKIVCQTFFFFFILMHFWMLCRHYHWEHAVFLYTHYDEYDQAANTMMVASSFLPPESKLWSMALTNVLTSAKPMTSVLALWTADCWLYIYIIYIYIYIIFVGMMFFFFFFYVFRRNTRKEGKGMEDPDPQNTRALDW